jgi:hypothetical protein
MSGQLARRVLLDDSISRDLKVSTQAAFRQQPPSTQVSRVDGFKYCCQPFQAKGDIGCPFSADEFQGLDQIWACHVR